MSCRLMKFLLPASKRYHHICDVLMKPSGDYSSNCLGNKLSNIRVTSVLFSKRTIFTSSYLSKKARITVTFVKSNGERITASGKEGESFLDVVVNNNLDIAGYGACEGTLSCSTCHLIFGSETYDRIEEKETDEERDILDLALGITPTSRLGCQVLLTKELDGCVVNIPAAVRDARETPTQLI